MNMALDEHVTLIRRGRCHVFGDDVPVEDGIIPRRFVAERNTDPSVLRHHLFETIDPAFAARVKPGDIVVAGRNFASGKPRVQGFIALAALDLAVVCVSMPYKMLRRAVAQGIPVISGAPSPQEIATTGDELEIDFASGWIRNLTECRTIGTPVMPVILRSIVASGGMREALLSWLAAHPEQALKNGQP